MSIATAFQKVEKSLEKEILAFFQLLGASEAPEEWECTHAPAETARDERPRNSSQPPAH